MRSENRTNTFAKFTFLIPLIVSTAIITSFFRLPGITADGHIYLQIARNIRYGIGLGWQALWCPPMHSILIALVSWLPGVPDIQTAAGIVSSLMGILLPAAVYFLAAGLFTRPVAVAAAITTAAFPQFVFLSFSTDADITYCVFLICALALLLATVKRESILLACLSGVFFSLAYQTRSEGFLILLFTLIVLCVLQGKSFYKSALSRCCAVVLVAFILVSSPYLLFLKKNYGEFVISPKSTYVLIWMKSRIYHDNDKGEIANEELWGLTPDGKYAWQHPSGISALAGYLASHPMKSLQVYFSNLFQEIPGRIPNNSGCLHYPQVFPIYLVIPALFMAFRRWGANSAYGKAIIFSPFLLLLILPIFTEGWWKYLVPYSPLIFIAGFAGIYQIMETIFERYKKSGAWRIATVSTLLLATLLAAHYLSILLDKPSQERSGTNQQRLNLAEESRNAGLMARKIFGPGRNYMVPWSKIIYHLGGLWTATPVADYPDLIKFARRNKVDYIIMEYNSSLTSIYDLPNVPPDVKLAEVYMSPRSNYMVAFYRLLY